MRVAMIAREKVANGVRKDQWFANENFRMPCIGVIHGIAKMEPVSQKDVALWVGVDPSDLVGMLDQLENAEFVVRKRDPQDRRRQLLSLTKKGNEARKRLMKIGSQSMDETLAPLNDKERETLKSMLTRVLEHHELKKLETES